MRINSLRWVALFALLAGPQSIEAQNARGQSADAARASMANSHEAAPRTTATRATGGIAVDGRLDEAVWTQTRLATEFTQLDPVEGAPATERTEVRFVFDDRALYIGATLHDTQPPTSRLGRRDADLPDSDWFAVSLDTYHDHLTAYRFAVNPSGVKRDEVMTGTSMFGGDDTWDPVWEAETRVTEAGWTVEMRIPLSQLRFSRDEEQTWGVQIERRIGRKNEHVVFAFTPRTVRGGVARYGHMDGISGLSASAQRVELLPYLLARADYRAVPTAAGVDFSNPFRDGSRGNAGFGLDLKVRPTSNLTIDGTVNPDFGQVEVDPAVINLTAFETRFQEKRPFFVEGSDLFRFGGGDFGGFGRGGGGGGFGGFGGGGGEGGGPSSLLYSRRIGRAPQVGVSSGAAYADVPEATTILGAAKVLARTSGGWSVGVMEAVTGRERARWVDRTGAESVSEVEPLTNYLAGRIRRDLRAGQTTLGVLATAVNRDVSDAAVASRLRSSAYSGGADFRHEWHNRAWSVNGYLAGSHIRGDSAVLIATQRASTRYYQRADAGHVSVDSMATSMSGFSGRIDVGKRAGTWRGNVALSTTSPGYEINDIGFQTSADRISLDGNMNYEQTRPGRIFRRWSLRVGPDLEWNYDGDRIGTSIGGGGNGQFMNFWNFGYNFRHEFESLDDRLTRGGVLASEPAGNSGFLFLSTDSRRSTTGRLSLSGNWSDAGDWRTSVNVNVGFRPGENLDFQVGPNFSRSGTVAQYLTRVTDATALHTAGRRYVFAELEQTTLSIDTRINITFQPGLTLELYAQPFVSSGDYGAIKELKAPRTFMFTRYGIDAGTLVRRGDGYVDIDPDGAGPAAAFTLDDRDFDFRSLRGNAVLRWEWRPGSTLFLVWQQSRAAQLTPLSGAEGVGHFRLGSDAADLFRLRPDNIFIIKATYWLNP